MAEIASTLYIISDLHLGGEADEGGGRGFRICTHEDELAQFVDSLTALEGPGIELVINGDSVDFLAEKVRDDPPAWEAFHYPESGAVECLDRIATRSARVFEAIRRFSAKGHRLVILPGNHDVELNLPLVRRRLQQLVGATGRCDYEFVGNGEAYRVGDVVIEHGNRVDDMNFVDYNTLRLLCGFLSRGLPVRDEFLFDPPAGSMLVAQVINGIKRQYGFIDLLKPEKDAAFPVILALEPGRRGELLGIAKALAEGKRRRMGQLRRYKTNISSRPEGTGSEEANEPEGNALEAVLRETVGRPDFAAPPPGSAKAQISARGQIAGMFSLLSGKRDESWDKRLSDLLEALRSFQGPDSFNRQVETEKSYLDAARSIAQGPVRHVAFGHTHLAKHVDLGGGRSYLNSGTWADLLELPQQILDKTRLYAPLGELDELLQNLVRNDFSSYQTFRPTYLRIEQDAQGNSLACELCDYPRQGKP